VASARRAAIARQRFGSEAAATRMTVVAAALGLAVCERGSRGDARTAGCNALGAAGQAGRTNLSFRKRQMFDSLSL
jgi:hypothetical protein